MTRNLDLTALRSFATVAEAGGVTRAAGLLSLTQSAVSMQVKRLEESLDLQLLDRSGRGVTLTAAGEQLLSYARRMIALNDEAWTRLSARDDAGEIVLGVPCDVVYPVIPVVLRRFARDFPRVKIKLISSFTRRLRAEFAQGELDLILTTDDRAEPGSEALAVRPLVWVGAPGGLAWAQRPLRLAFASDCIFRQPALRRLDQAGIPWEMATDTTSEVTVEATVSADLAVTALIEGGDLSQRYDRVEGLPELWTTHINLYMRRSPPPAAEALADLLRQEFQAVQRPRPALAATRAVA
jgi:DNA-binding transcriptional LysR family regulator